MSLLLIGVFQNHTEIPGDTREAYQQSAAFGVSNVQILWLPWECDPSSPSRGTFLLYGYYHNNYIGGNAVNLYVKTFVTEANNSVISCKKTVFQSLESKHVVPVYSNLTGNCKDCLHSQ